MHRIIVENIEKKFKIGYKKNLNALERIKFFLSRREPQKIIKALDGVSFKAKAGEMVGVIGRNGSGKSTLLRCIAGIYLPDKGEIQTTGKMISLIGLQEGLRYRLTMKENIYLVATLFGFTNLEIKKRYGSIVKFAGLGDFVNTKLHQFSVGMVHRLVFSIVIHSNSEILLLDEAIEVGDEEFKKKSLKKIKGLVKKGATVILATHFIAAIRRYCSKAILMEKGKILAEGEPKEVVDRYIGR